MVAEGVCVGGGAVSCQTDDTEEFSEFPTAERQVWLSNLKEAREPLEAVWEKTSLLWERGGKEIQHEVK